MDRVYRIARWDEVFENNESRKLKSLKWVAFPVDMDSNGFLSLVETFGNDAPTIYGAWAALVCVAAKCPQRGTLTNTNGSPMSLARIAGKARFPLGAIERLFAWATTEDVGWIQVAEEYHEPPETPGESPDESGAHEHDTTRPEIELPTNETERASGRPSCAGERIVLDDAQWIALVPLRQRIARVVTGNQNIRSRDLPSKDWRLCCVAAALAGHRLGQEWLDSILESISDRSEAPQKRWGHFRGCLIESAKRLGQSFHELEKIVALPERKAPATSPPAPSPA